jgi:hypothetical protein
MRFHCALLLAGCTSSIPAGEAPLRQNGIVTEEACTSRELVNGEDVGECLTETQGRYCNDDGFIEYFDCPATNACGENEGGVYACLQSCQGVPDTGQCVGSDARRWCQGGQVRWESCPEDTACTVIPGVGEHCLAQSAGAWHCSGPCNGFGAGMCFGDASEYVAFCYGDEFCLGQCFAGRWCDEDTSNDPDLLSWCFQNDPSWWPETSCGEEESCE